MAEIGLEEEWRQDEMEERQSGMVSENFIYDKLSFDLKHFVQGCSICVNAGRCQHAGAVGPVTATSRCECESLCDASPTCYFWDYGVGASTDCYFFASCPPPYPLDTPGAVNGPNGTICSTTTLTAITTANTSTTTVLGSIVSMIPVMVPSLNMGMGETGIIWFI